MEDNKVLSSNSKDKIGTSTPTHCYSQSILTKWLTYHYHYHSTSLAVQNHMSFSYPSHWPSCSTFEKPCLFCALHCNFHRPLDSSFQPRTMTLAGALAILFLLLALYCGFDPFGHSPIADFPEFETRKVDLPAWSDVPTDVDAENLLQKSEIKFFNQVQGPESIAFDPLARGPYTGVADGRILFWNGHSWTDFAYTSSNRSEFFSLSSISVAKFWVLGNGF